MKDIIRLISSIFSVLIVLSVITRPIEASAIKTCLYYDEKRSCQREAIAGSNYCSKHTCIESGCYNKARFTDSRCESCNKRFYDKTENAVKVCAVEGCYIYKVYGGFYCSNHTCHNKSCNNKALYEDDDDYLYCWKHSCDNIKYGCTNEVFKAGDICSKCKKNPIDKSKVKVKTKNTYKSSSSKSKSSKKKVVMPDCDDYDSFDDFMDDWDGCMPDGSDAEDYWENW